MKIKTIIILVLMVFTGCTSSKTYLERGNFDMAAKKAMMKLQKKPGNTRQLWVLTQSYKQAEIQNLDRIDYLRKTGQPDIWEEVFQNYNTLKKRQDMAKTLPQQILATIKFNYHDYDQDMIEAEKKACEYYYAHGNKLLSANDKLSARQAYDEFMKIKKHYADFKDVNELIKKALELGTSHVILYFQNNSNANLPDDFLDEFQRISLSDEDSKWVKYDVKERQNVKYDFTIVMNLKDIAISPERFRERSWIEAKTIQDGWIYKLDNNGNVMKDSLGNDIKEPKYIKIVCHVKEFDQNKEAVLSGKLDFYNNVSGQLITSENIIAKSVFGNGYIVANGDMRALNPDTQSMLGNAPMPYPSDYDMIMKANEILQNAVKDMVRNKSYLIK